MSRFSGLTWSSANFEQLDLAGQRMFEAAVPLDFATERVFCKEQMDCQAHLVVCYTSEACVQAAIHW